MLVGGGVVGDIVVGNKVITLINGVGDVPVGYAVDTTVEGVFDGSLVVRKFVVGASVDMDDGSFW